MKRNPFVISSLALPPAVLRPFALLCLGALGGCAADPRDIGRAPHMTAVGAGLQQQAAIPADLTQRPGYYGPVRSLWDRGAGDLFRDARASQVGDLITVAILIDDKADVENNNSRSRDSSIKNSFDGSGDMPGLAGSISGDFNASGYTSSKGEGKIKRSEQVRLSVAAVVTDILPNGNLLITGSQEVRVNYELRVLSVSGIVRPRDVSRDNIISYEKIAEARISYGGRGRLSETGQPALAHQLFDLLRPI